MKATMKRWWWYWRLMMVVIVVVVLMSDTATSDPQINHLLTRCSQYNATNLANFFRNLNASLVDLRSQLSNNNTHFATADHARTSDPVFAMVQCRNFLSTADCVACFNAAVSEIRKCKAADGGRIFYDGCFLRYVTFRFYDQTTQLGNVELCGNRTASQPTAFDEAVKGLLADLEVATPKINGFFAATKTQVVGGNASVYAVAQCVETVSERGCKACLTVAYGNIQSCSPYTDARAIDVGCFLRYSDTPFFADNQTTNINPFLGEESYFTGSTKQGLNHWLKIAIGISTSVAGLVLISILMICCIRKKYLWTKNDQNVEAFFRNYGSHVPKRYNYLDIKKMTNSFRDKLGKGGYGIVYKGKLLDGQLVAVKVLSETKGNGEKFMNEVASISRTSHVNVVTFLGFCYERNKRALVYEFMNKGSLDKFIYSDGSHNLNCHLDCKTIYQIAVGVARGLEYLHRGCSTRIVHFDIKPHNILLDNDFCPKIADFGLAKLGQRKESIMSMVGARGTIGYIAPEVFSRNFGGVSHKSDVYSYGMTILEMVGQRKDIKVTRVHSSEVYFPDYIYEQLEHIEDLNCVTSEEEKETAKRMTIVSLWCIQTNPTHRPSMTSVVEMLEGKLQPLQIPPKPILVSPIRLTQNSSLLLQQSSNTD